MKKIVSVLVALCLFCVAAAALAETVPAWKDIPLPVIEDENTTIDEAAFQGTWKADKAFVDETYIDQEALKTDYNVIVPNIRLADGKLYYDSVDENGEAVEHGEPYTFEAGQIGFSDETGNLAVIDLLEDGNLVMSLFLKGEGDEVQCISVYMVRADA